MARSPLVQFRASKEGSKEYSAVKWTGEYSAVQWSRDPQEVKLQNAFKDKLYFFSQFLAKESISDNE